MTRGGLLKRILAKPNLKPCKRCISSTTNIKDKILSNPNHIEVPKISLPHFVYGEFEKYSNLIALQCGITHRQLTFGDVRNYSRNFSKFLRAKLNLKPQDVALVYMKNCPEFQIVTLGTMEAGLALTTANSLYTPDELLKQIEDSCAKILITNHEMFEKASKANKKNLPIICVKTKADQCLPEGAIDFNQMINTKIDIPDFEGPDPENVVLLPYSSGTTGLPKGVMLSHRNLVASLLQYNQMGLIKQADNSFQEICPCVLPMYHIYGLMINSLAVMARGGKVITLPKFHPSSYVNVLKNNPVSLIYSAPPLVLFLTQHPEVKSEYFNSLRLICCAAAPLGATDEARFKEKAQKDVFVAQAYGMTEASPTVTVNTEAAAIKHGKQISGTVGQVVANTEVKLVKVGDDTGEPLGPNEQGEILIRGPQIMKGYLNKPQATKEAFTGDWYKSGDLAYYDTNGFLYITDRLKELIKVKGYQVAPAELEELLRDHPKIEDAAVIGIPHEQHGEVPRAYVKPKENVDVQDIHKFVYEKVAKYKRLEGGIELIEQIPKSASGKILRRELKLKYMQDNK